MAATKTKKPKSAVPPAAKLPPIEVAKNLPTLVSGQYELKNLWFDTKSDRDPALEEREIRALAESIAVRGQLQPVLITRFGAPADKWRVVAGRRRVRAMRDVLKLGWCDATAMDLNSEADVLAARETENLQRQDLNPAEEATAVANLLEAVAQEALCLGKGYRPDQIDRTIPAAELLADATIKAKAIELVAARLAKSPTWVRDRAFLDQLDGYARELVLSGDLPLASARLIAQVADPEAREELASKASARAAYDGRPMAVDLVRVRVAEYLYSLREVPWKLDVPFAGKPACTTCEFNSKNSPGLFEDGRARVSVRHNGTTNAEGAGVCTQHACWRHKNSAAGAALAKAAKKAEAAVLTVKGKPTEALVKAKASEAAPAFIRPAAVRERAQSRLDAGRTRKHEESRAAPKTSETESSLRRQAEWKLTDALREWVDKQLNPAMQRWLAARPGAWPLFVLLQEHEMWHKIPGQHGAKVLQTPGWRSLVGLLKQPSWDGLLQLERGGKRMYGLLEVSDARSGIAQSLIEILGVEVAKPPTIDKFLPPELRAKDAAKPAPPAKARKPGPAKPHSPDDDDPGQMGGGDAAGADDEEDA
jgi:ParB-like chromosome segregation protein Spo0J